MVRLLPSGRRAVVRSPHFTPLEKSPAIIKLIEDGISQAQKQKFNDLLSEIGDFYGREDVTRIGHTHPNPLSFVPEQGAASDEQIVHDHDEVPVDEPFNFFGTPDQSEPGETPTSPQAPHEPAQDDHPGTTMGESPSLPAPTTPTLRRSSDHQHGSPLGSTPSQTKPSRSASTPPATCQRRSVQRSTEKRCKKRRGPTKSST